MWNTLNQKEVCCNPFLGGDSGNAVRREEEQESADRIQKTGFKGKDSVRWGKEVTRYGGKMERCFDGQAV
jgi:hypothetical protein